jgi:penicillin V acylase-like amidase (Ntn superfamily)
MNRFISLILLSTFSFTVFPCTTFMQATSKQAFMAKNFDWKSGQGEIILNTRNTIKKSITSEFDWQSRYASFTFNQFGPDLPAGGINEKGLAIEALVLPNTKHPISNHNLVNEGEWIQYQLDSFSTTQEVLANIKDVNIRRDYVNVHYFICDAKTNCSVVEYINGKRIIHTNLKQNVLTNHAYKTSLEALKSPEKFNMSSVAASLNRFKIMVSSKVSDMDPAGFYKQLDLVSLGGYTQWQIVYDLFNKELNFKTNKRDFNTNIKFSDYALECNQDLKVLNLSGNSIKITKAKGLKLDVIKRLNNTKEIKKDIKNKIIKRVFKNNCSN